MGDIQQVQFSGKLAVSLVRLKRLGGVSPLDLRPFDQWQQAASFG